MNEMHMQPRGTWRTYCDIVDKLDNAVSNLERRATDPPPEEDDPLAEPGDEDSVH